MKFRADEIHYEVYIYIKCRQGRIKKEKTQLAAKEAEYEREDGLRHSFPLTMMP